MSEDDGSNNPAAMGMQSDPPAAASAQTASDADSGPDPLDVPHQGTPLAGLLLLIAVAAVAAAIVGSGLSGVTFDDRFRPPPRFWGAPPAKEPPNGLHWVDSAVATTMVIFFAVLVAVIGVVVGLWRPPRVRRGLVGGMTGLVIGAATGLMMCCPPRFGAILSGAAVILAAALVYRVVSREPG